MYSTCCLGALSRGVTAVDWATFDSSHTCKCASPLSMATACFCILITLIPPLSTYKEHLKNQYRAFCQIKLHPQNNILSVCNEIITRKGCGVTEPCKSFQKSITPPQDQHVKCFANSKCKVPSKQPNSSNLGGSDKGLHPQSRDRVSQPDWLSEILLSLFWSPQCWFCASDECTQMQKLGCRAIAV